MPGVFSKKGGSFFLKVERLLRAFAPFLDCRSMFPQGLLPSHPAGDDAAGRRPFLYCPYFENICRRFVFLKVELMKLELFVDVEMVNVQNTFRNCWF